MSENLNKILEYGKKLPLVEEFYSIQGEGFYTGTPAYFIRIGGCDVGCNWCDAKFTWNAKNFPPVCVDDIINNIIECKAFAVVVTGGEPSLYNLDYFTQKAKENNIRTFIETSGIKKLTGEWDWICLSPKRQSPPHQSLFSIADELKVIVQDESYFEWAEENAKKVNSNCHLFLQPEWSQSQIILPKIVDYVKNDPKWKISLQSHKYMKIP